jgi:hypothetical protein
MKNHSQQENTVRVLATTLALWGAGAALAAGEGVLAKLSPAALVTLAVFTAACALAAYVLDPGVRSVASRASLRALLAIACALDGIVAVAAAVLARGDGSALERLAYFPFAFIALFVAPLAIVATFAAIARAHRPRVSSAPARSPGARPAAT